MQLPIAIQQPRPFDIVGHSVHFVGLALAHTSAVRVQLLAADGSLLAARVVRGENAGELSTFDGVFELEGSPGDPTGCVAMANARTDGDRIEVPIVFGTALQRRYIGYATYVVRPGDTLWLVAERMYGAGDRWSMLHQANRHLIADPDVIHPGQELRIPRAVVPG